MVKMPTLMQVACQAFVLFGGAPDRMHVA